ncbi:MAG: serine/threonine protein kinase, partial [Victivallales bacterium]|nr:serine/threonine protein kinase [Victivallales bacterium]
MFTVNSSLEFRRKLEYTDRRYKRIKLMATGGYGRIFMVEDNVLGRKAVVKSLKEELLEHPDIVRKFLTEAKLNAQLDHPSIVTVFSLDTDSSDGLHMAMQLINGITLKEYLARTLEEHQKNNWSNAQATRLLQERLEIFLHICDAIDYSHSKGIIHCDIKPDNVMIGRYGEVYVMDWGIAAADGCNRKENLDGTPSYMPPETLRDGVTNKQTDVFAL